MTMNANVVEADLVYHEGRFQRGCQIEITDSGRIARMGSLGLRAARPLAGQAVLPGMVNVHSHAFQRGLRGYGEDFPQGAGDFWSWREAMYALVEPLHDQSFRHLCVQAFREMLGAGITTVGEFHYLHHDASCAGYAFDDLVLEAAREAGIRICLLCCYYRTGGVGRPLYGGQRRFGTPDVGAFLHHVYNLRRRSLDPLQTIGIAPHSIRAVGPDELAPLAEYARKNGLVLHMHVEEQRQEIADCLAAYGKTPMALVVQEVQPGPSFTAVHATHSSDDDLAQLGETGANICRCPLTEGNLGDGIADHQLFLERGGHLCLGTDSNLRLDFAEEMRWLEYVQRVRHERRGALRDAQGRTGSMLWRCATLNGARSLGIEAGELAAGRWADFFTLNLNHPTLAGWTDSTLLDSFIFGSGREAITSTWVAGVRTHHGSGGSALSEPRP